MFHQFLIFQGIMLLQKSEEQSKEEYIWYNLIYMQTSSTSKIQIISTEVQGPSVKDIVMCAQAFYFKGRKASIK